MAESIKGLKRTRAKEITTRKRRIIETKTRIDK